MTRFRVGVLSALGITLASWSPGTPTQAQSPATSVQSIKITLAPTADKKGCQIQSPVPQTSGVYSGDTLVWHVENGCSASAEVSVTMTAVGSAPEVSKAFKVNTGLSSGSVTSLNRSQITAQVAVQPDLGTTYEYNYVVHPQTPSGLPDIKGKIIMCRQPPCPSP